MFVPMLALEHISTWPPKGGCTNSNPLGTMANAKEQLNSFYGCLVFVAAIIVGVASQSWLGFLAGLAGFYALAVYTKAIR